MVMKPQKPYLLVSCRKCGWEQFYHQTGDVFLYSPTCPECHSSDVALRQMSFWGKVAHQLKKQL
ncbi:hypothetical protein CFR73_07205 [Novacetimonas maltaceti]|uniref:Uncharacterized protein n=1 Tax=Novacetimonas maltaceti TaxID=1203393 RepID=A0A2S3VXH9_9PROT|nr:hypothetical protein KMAL_30850 [Novacetimonas maltaceti]PYD60441.1 hypothetical protein CFR73_07205 [Novacetimonas maltaceti]